MFSNECTNAFVLLVLLRLISSERPEISRLCIIQSSCKSCLEASTECSWCSDWNYSNSTIGRPRCNTKSRLLAFGCGEKFVVNAVPGSIEFLQDEDFQDVTHADQLPVQLRPQRAHVRLRPGTSETLRLRYRPAKNYPLDLYYLMDLTWSMKDDKETLVGVGRRMANTLGSFTTNFRLGFGSYADKPLMPYIFPGHESNPCKSAHTTCAPLYSFRHRMALAQNVEKFVRMVNNSAVTGNVDNLEGGLDAVVQAVSCTEQVKWAHHARKIMLIATDGSLHFAGDGKLGGAVRRQDSRCHLDQNGEYSLSTEFDYPSLAEVSRLLRDNKVNLIFAVTEDRREEYERTAVLLEEKARVATLTENSSNILEIIEKSYREIVEKVVLRDNSSNRALSIDYYSNCGEEDKKLRRTSTCENIKEAHVYDFNIRFSVKDCPTNSSLWKQTVVIDDALASEASEVIVDIELLCGCDCQEKNPRCHHGINECGICKCDFGWTGETCDCEISSWAENSIQCIKPGESLICSNRGECNCGKCECDPGYNGPYCECSPCDKVDGIECGGRGTCRCGQCICLDGWEGSACQCPSGNRPCIAPGSDNVCANHGYCDCGHCRCNMVAPDGLLYRGTYCESSVSDGGSGFCSLYSSCVNSTVENPDEASEFCHTNYTSYKIVNVDFVSNDHEHYCFVRTVDDSTVCMIPYIYEFNPDNTVTLNIAKKECFTPMPAIVLPGAISLAVVLLGILILLIWKCWTAIVDRREYAQFEKEQRKTIYALSVNPLYKPATSEFRVPSMIKED